MVVEGDKSVLAQCVAVLRMQPYKTFFVLFPAPNLRPVPMMRQMGDFRHTKTNLFIATTMTHCSVKLEWKKIVQYHLNGL